MSAATPPQRAADPAWRVRGRRLAGMAAAQALIATGADAWFLHTVGVAGLGWAIAVSAFLLMGVLAWVGGHADRVGRTRLQATIAVIGGGGLIVCAAIGGLVPSTASVAAVIAMIASKQALAAQDLALWADISARLDPRDGARVVPVLVAQAGVGAVVGAVTAAVLSAWVSAPMLLGVGAVAWLGLGVVGGERGVRLAAHRPTVIDLAEGARVVIHRPLFAAFAWATALAGTVAALAYFVFAGAAAAAHAEPQALATWLSVARAVTAAITVIVQLAGPRLIRRFGVTRLRLATPLLLAAAAGLVWAWPGVGTAFALHTVARVLDAAIATPCDRVVLGLVPPELRGRVGGFVDGVAKRLGGLAGGLIGAGLFGAWMLDARGLALVTVALAVVWLLAEALVRARIPVAAAGAGHAAPQVMAVRLFDEALRAEWARGLMADAATAHATQATLVAMHQAQRLDARPLFAQALGRTAATADPQSLERCLHGLWACAPLVRTEALRVAALACAARIEDPTLALASRQAVARLVILTEVPWPSRPSLDPAWTAIANAAATGDEALAEVLRDQIGVIGPAAGLAEGVLIDRLRLTAPAAALGGLGARVLRRQRVGEQACTHLAHALTTAAHVAADADPAVAAGWLVVRADVLAWAETTWSDHESTPALAAAAVETWTGLAPAAAVHALHEALGDPREPVRDAAAAAVTRAPVETLPAVVLALASSRRVGRDHAARLLFTHADDAALPRQAIADALAREVDALGKTVRRARALEAWGQGWVARRLHERASEHALTALRLHIAVRDAQGLLPLLAQWTYAASDAARARAVAALELALPPELAREVVPALDPHSDVGRATLTRGPRARVAPGGPLRGGLAAPLLANALRAELAVDDPVSRGLILAALSADERHALRADLERVAAQVGASRRVRALASLTANLGARDEDDPSMNGPVDAIVALGAAGLWARCSARQLEALAARAQWVRFDDGAIAIEAGEVVDALWVVIEGALVAGPTRVGPQASVDELAPFAPRPAPQAWRAVGRTVCVRIDAVDIGACLDDVAGLGAELVRGLAERAQRA